MAEKIIGSASEASAAHRAAESNIRKIAEIEERIASRDRAANVSQNALPRSAAA